MVGLKVTLIPQGVRILLTGSKMSQTQGIVMGGPLVIWSSLGAALVPFHYPPGVTIRAKGLPDVPDLTILVHTRGADGFCPAMKGLDHCKFCVPGSPDICRCVSYLYTVVEEGRYSTRLNLHCELD